MYFKKNYTFFFETNKRFCFRNPHHFKEFKHQHLHNLLKQYPDHKVDKDTGIGIENIKEQLKVYEDIEKFFLWAEHKKQTKKRSRSKSPEAQRKKELKVDPAITAQTVLSETRTESAQVNSEQTGKSESSKEGGPLCLIEQKLEAAKPFNFFLTKENIIFSPNSENLFLKSLIFLKKIIVMNPVFDEAGGFRRSTESHFVRICFKLKTPFFGLYYIF